MSLSEAYEAQSLAGRSVLAGLKMRSLRTEVWGWHHGDLRAAVTSGIVLKPLAFAARLWFDDRQLQQTLTRMECRFMEVS